MSVWNDIARIRWSIDQLAIRRSRVHEIRMRCISLNPCKSWHEARAIRVYDKVGRKIKQRFAEWQRAILEIQNGNTKG